MTTIDQVAVEVFGGVSVDDRGVASPLPGLEICPLPGGHALVHDHILDITNTASTAIELTAILQDIAARRDASKK